MARRRSFRLAAGAALLGLIAGAAAAQVGPPRPGPRCLPGEYDGGQMEMAARLQLGADHRFRYMLSYGALDEVAQGTWESDGAEGVRLTSDPTTPPRFTFQEEARGVAGELRVTLALPESIARQHFSAIVRFANGRSVVRQMHDDGLVLELGPEDRPVSVTMLLPVFDLESEAAALQDGRGASVTFRFDPNDLGRVAFEHTELKIDRDDLLLDRHERQIRFRREPGGC